VTNEHIGDVAELYALGTLSTQERAQVDWHARQCDTCAARLGEAQEAVAALVQEMEPSGRLDARMHATFAGKAPRRAMWPALVAAAFIIGLLPAFALWPGLGREAQIASDRQAATVAMVNSHFSHAPFVSAAHSGIKAKVLFSRNADWLFIVAQTARPYTVIANENGTPKVLGTLRVNGEAGELFIPHAGRPQALSLEDGGQVVGRVTLPYRR
jgi:anti-sigma-K factor RskA